MARKGARPKRRERKNIERGIAHIQSTFNNTVVTITDVNGNTVAWSSAGANGFKGSRKSTPFAAQTAAEAAAKAAMEHGIEDGGSNGQGAGGRREAAVRSLQAAGLEITAIKDVTPSPTMAAVHPNGGACNSNRRCYKIWPDIQDLFVVCAAGKGSNSSLKGERCYTPKCAIERRNYPPGQHGQSRRRNPSEFGLLAALKSKKCGAFTA